MRLPQHPARLRDDLRPIEGLLPSTHGFIGTTGQPLTVGTGITRAAIAEGWVLDFTGANTGITAPTSITDHGPGLSCIVVGRNDAVASFNCFSSIATTGDRF